MKINKKINASFLFVMVFFFLKNTKAQQSFAHGNGEAMYPDTVIHQNIENYWTQNVQYIFHQSENDFYSDSLEYARLNQMLKESIKRVNTMKSQDARYKPKDVFETTEEYKRRIFVADSSYDYFERSQTSYIKESIAKMSTKDYFIPSGIRVILAQEKYDADNSAWSVEIEDKGNRSFTTIKLNPETAKDLWKNQNRMRVYYVKHQSTHSWMLAICCENVIDPICLSTEIDAYFPGGEGAWRNFLAKNVNVQVPGSNGAPAGTYSVIVRFIVSKDGTVSDVQPETNFGYGMEAELVRAVKKSGKWTPAIQNGRNVVAYKRQAITYTVSD